MDGIARCTRYAFGPNRVHLCGPDANSEIRAYMNARTSDDGLTGILKQFRTFYPYVETIARSNNVEDPFDTRVVEAYWIGNELLESIPARIYHKHLVDRIELKKRYPIKSFRGVETKLKQGARMHHNFHVFNLYKRTGHKEIPHTVDSMDKCRVSWGRVISIDGPSVRLRRRPLIVSGNILAIGAPEEVKMKRKLTDDDVLGQAAVGDTISLHWDEPCEILSPRQHAFLRLYTNHAIALANLDFT